MSAKKATKEALLYKKRPTVLPIAAVEVRDRQSFTKKTRKPASRRFTRPFRGDVQSAPRAMHILTATSRTLVISTIP